MSGQWPGRAGAEECPWDWGRGPRGGGRGWGRTWAQRCHSYYLPLSGDPCRHPAHPLAAGSGVAWGGQGAYIGLPTALGWLRVCAGLFSTKDLLTRQTRLRCLPGSRLQGTRGPPGLGTAGVAQTSLPCLPAPAQAKRPPRTEIAGGKGAEREVWRTVCRK